MTEGAKQNFKGQGDDEVVICYFRRHWLTLVSTLFSIILMIGLLVGAVFFLPFLNAKNAFVESAVIFAFVLFTIFLHRQFLKIFYFFLHTVIITNYRIVEVDRSVFLKDSKSSIDLVNVQDIEKVQSGLLQTIFNFGSLKIFLSGSSTPTTITMVPRPEYQYKKINQVKVELAK